MKKEKILRVNSELRSLSKIASMVLFFGVLFVSAFVFNSCTKKGCTSTCATNYDSKAKKDDGSCRGCTNKKANNYCADADNSDQSCTCGGYGFLSAQNKSNTTIQKIVIGNTNYGTLDPGEIKEVRLPNGTHTVEFQAVSGGGGCTPAEVIITECGTEIRSCSY
ncbi:MAG: hypothetical protein HUU48_12600 [Flavobacteriales bacterium]|nr:hypothetical protein [Flavobacteriales bacterium]